jgi:hypothetical protein
MTTAARSSGFSWLHPRNLFRKDPWKNGFRRKSDSTPMHGSEVRFDPDAWIVETEDRAGRHFLDLARD